MTIGSNKYVIVFLAAGAVITSIYARTVDNNKLKSEIAQSANGVSISPTSSANTKNAKLTPSPMVSVASDTTLSPSPIVSPQSTPQPTPLVTPTNSEVTPSVTPSDTRSKTGRVVINEIAWSGTVASAFDEWIELYNNENYDVSMSGWRLMTESESPKIAFQAGSYIPANGYYLIERTDDNAVSNVKADYTVGFGNGLSDSGEVLILRDSDLKEVDRVGTWGDKWFAGDSSSRTSMERISPLIYSNGSSNWRSFTGTASAKDSNGNAIMGTPKLANSIAPTPTPQVTPLVTLSPVVTPTPTVIVTPSPSDTILPSPLVTPSPDATPTPVVTPSPSPTQTLSPSSSLMSQVIINEIAWMGTSSEFASDEWIELYNYSSSTVDISGWTLKSLTGSNPDPVINLSGSIPEYGYYLLERTDDTTISDIQADQIYTGNLSDTCEVLELRDNNGDLVDKVSCIDTSWYGGKKSTRSTMERVNTQSGETKENWGTNNGNTKNGLNASGGVVNGTPRKANSISN